MHFLNNCKVPKYFPLLFVALYFQNATIANKCSLLSLNIGMSPSLSLKNYNKIFWNHACRLSCSVTMKNDKISKKWSEMFLIYVFFFFINHKTFILFNATNVHRWLKTSWSPQRKSLLIFINNHWNSAEKIEIVPANSGGSRTLLPTLWRGVAHTGTNGGFRHSY